ncbi:VOC family protein [Paenibacillus whitsoniae]|uniref:VOC family protein n=1 Tax=Paenibacillus whitsoniae TaxID=2496558 RepID=A0A430J8U0_9BACL|nr:VOC family protein [Paenibacillus whitsoniae]RTE06834.1 VOC family protein [Paenibacillus whitsoniae]
MSIRLTPYLVLNGNAREAVGFYEKALGAQVAMLQTFGEAPEHPDFKLPEEAKNLVNHAMIQIGEATLMFSDTFPGQPVQVGNNVTICLQTNDLDKAKQFYEALKDGGNVILPFSETFFSPGYAQLTDRFGVTFHIFAESAAMN